jgi:hypothetical protein
MFITISILLLVPAYTWPSSEFSHAPFDSVLSNYVDEKGLVNYQGLQEHRETLDDYIVQLSAVSPHSNAEHFPTANHQLAYWINAYNALVLRGIIDAYPVESVMDIRLFNGFFNRTEWTVGGHKMTLDHIENAIIRPGFGDVRIHFVLNCGARSCPPLERSSFNGDSLDARLDAAAQRFVSNPQLFELREDGLYLSKILDWYRPDFSDYFPTDRIQLAQRDPLISYFSPLIPASSRKQLSQPNIPIRFMDYDWSLNEQIRPIPDQP